MRKLKIGVIDLVTNGSTRTLWARTVYANLASIMPQVIATWCEEEGHTVTYVCYTGFENLEAELPDNLDLVFIGTFSQGAQLAYALSNFFQSQGQSLHLEARTPGAIRKMHRSISIMSSVSPTERSSKIFYKTVRLIVRSAFIFQAKGSPRPCRVCKRVGSS